MLRYYSPPGPFITEHGISIPLTIAYTVSGTAAAGGSNVAWICHALTANAAPEEWWPGVVGSDAVINPETHFIVCAAIIGSPYGSTNAQSINPATGAAFGVSFPLVTVRDMVRAHALLRAHLGIQKIALLAGGSMGGYQALEWALTEPDKIDRLFLLATAAAESPWGIAIHTAQRMAIEADPTWIEPAPGGGAAGLKAARAIGMISYRNHAMYAAFQSEPSLQKAEGFRAESYIRYQGDKLAARFNAQCYHGLTRSMDTHNIARGRAGSAAEVLSRIAQRALIISISSDLLCPPVEQQQLAAHMPAATLIEIDSPYGHDGFLVEAARISAALNEWMAAE